MINKLINALAWVSLLLAFIVFIISYASFPEEILAYVNANGEPQLYLERNTFFYTSLFVVAIFNIGWIAARALVKRTSPGYTNVLAGLGFSQIFFNMFFATAIYFINILNSRENFDYSNFGYLIYVSGGLLVASLVYTVVARFVLKK